MVKNKENISKPNYRIKLLAGNNVVLVEANDYESEIFVPQIVNGRIAFQNIIPNRRCCQTSNNTSKADFKYFPLKDSNNSTQKTKNNLSNSDDKSRIFANRNSAMPLPLANSTPAGDKHRVNCGKLPTQNLYNINSCIDSIDSTLPTPEPARRAASFRPQVFEKSINLPKGIKVTRIYHKSSNCTPKKLGRIIPSCLNSSFLDNSRINCSFSLHTSPTIPKSNSTQSKRSAAIRDSIAQWKKVLTPVRTYTRGSKKPVLINRPVSVSSARKVIPTYLVNPTKGPNITQTIEMKKRKLIIDSKVSISPKTFKKQQKETALTIQSPKALRNKSYLFNSLTHPKSRQYLSSMAMTAFDLLTNSNRNHCISSKLNQQFRKGCINKASSTYSKYKVLSTVPLLQPDEQVLELNRISIRSH